MLKNVTRRDFFAGRSLKQTYRSLNFANCGPGFINREQNYTGRNLNFACSSLNDYHSVTRTAKEWKNYNGATANKR